MRNKPLYFFCHIPKTAGTTFQSLIKNNVGDRYYRVSEQVYPFGSWYEKDRSKIDFIGGHVDWNFPEKSGLFKNREIIKFTFLRNPIDRALSFLYFSNPVFHKNPIEFFKKKTSGDWKYKSNTMTKFLAGIETEPNRNDFELAKERLKKTNIGFQECFAGSLVKFQNKYPDIFKKLKFDNKNVSKIEKKDTPELIDIIASVNGWDIELYMWAFKMWKE